MMKTKQLLVAGASVLFANFATAQDGQPQLTQEQIQQLLAQQQPPLPDMKLEEAIQVFSKGVAVNIGNELEENEYVDVELFKKTFLEALDGKIKVEDIDQKKFNDAHRVIQDTDNKKRKAEFDKKVEENREAGVKFLEENKKKEGVKVTKSGLQYKVLKAGEGVSPTSADQVKVHYTGKLIDGTVFDSTSRHPGKNPATFPLSGGLIQGWLEGIPLMKQGAKYEFVIPAEIAYGKQGSRDRRTGEYSILPDSTLVFEVELVEVIKAEEKKEEAKEEKKEAPKK